MNTDNELVELVIDRLHQTSDNTAIEAARLCAVAGQLAATASRLLKLAPQESLILSTLIDDLEISVRTANCLRRDNITYVGELVGRDERQLLCLPGFGGGSLREIKEALAMMGLQLQSKPGREATNSPRAKPRNHGLSVLTFIFLAISG